MNVERQGNIDPSSAGADLGREVRPRRRTLPRAVALAVCAFTLVDAGLGAAIDSPFPITHRAAELYEDVSIWGVRNFS